MCRLSPQTEGFLYATADRGKTRIPSRALLQRNAFLRNNGLVAVLVCARAPGLSWRPCKILRWMLNSIKNPYLRCKMCACTNMVLCQRFLANALLRANAFRKPTRRRDRKRKTRIAIGARCAGTRCLGMSFVNHMADSSSSGSTCWMLSIGAQ